MDSSKKLLYFVAGAANMIKSHVNTYRLNHGLYRKVEMPPYNPSILEKCYPYHESNCVSNDFKMNEECSFDASFIVPLYNSERVIPNLLDDLLNQHTDYKYEIILVNDGSVDHTEDICLDYSMRFPSKIVYLKEENHGISFARNAGIEIARGRFLSFVDHDDRVSSDYIDLLLKEAETADIVNCFYAVIRDGVQKEIGVSNGFVWGGLYRKTLFKNIRFPIGFWYEDMINPVLLNRVAKRVKIVEKVLYKYMLSPIQATKTLWKNDDPHALDQLYLIRGLCKDYNLLGYSDDEYLFQKVLKECSLLMYYRTKGLDVDVVVQVFLACRELVLSKYKEGYRINDSDKEWLNAFVDMDIAKWKLLGNC